jgi:hypothetical protein
MSKNTQYQQVDADTLGLDTTASLLLRADSGRIRYREFESSASANCPTP